MAVSRLYRSIEICRKILVIFGSVAQDGARWCKRGWLRIQSPDVQRSVDDSQRCLVCVVVRPHL